MSTIDLTALCHTERYIGVEWERRGYFRIATTLSKGLELVHDSANVVRSRSLVAQVRLSWLERSKLLEKKKTENELNGRM